MDHSKLTPKNKLEILEKLNQELEKLRAHRCITICGGGALLILDIIDRRTRDIDVVSPKIDPVLEIAAKIVGDSFGLAPNWLNNGPESLTRDLTSGWESRTITIYKGSALEVQSLGRTDLLATKMFAFCDREDDFSDLKKMNPTVEELDQIYEWTLARDASVYWPDRVRDCFSRLKNSLGFSDEN